MPNDTTGIAAPITTPLELSPFTPLFTRQMVPTTPSFGYGGSGDFSMEEAYLPTEAGKSILGSWANYLSLPQIRQSIAAIDTPEELAYMRAKFDPSKVPHLEELSYQLAGFGNQKNIEAWLRQQQGGTTTALENMLIDNPSMAGQSVLRPDIPDMYQGVADPTAADGSPAYYQALYDKYGVTQDDYSQAATNWALNNSAAAQAARDDDDFLGDLLPALALGAGLYFGLPALFGEGLAGAGTLGAIGGTSAEALAAADLAAGIGAAEAAGVGSSLASLGGTTFGLGELGSGLATLPGDVFTGSILGTEGLVPASLETISTATGLNTAGLGAAAGVGEFTIPGISSIVGSTPFDVASTLNAELPVGTTTPFSPDITNPGFSLPNSPFTPDYTTIPGVDGGVASTALSGELPATLPGSIYDGINPAWLDATGTATGAEMLEAPFNELPDATNPSTGLPDEQPPAEVTTTTPTNVTQPATTAKTNPFYDWLATKTGLSSNVIGGIVGGLSALARIQGAKDNKDSAQSAYNNARPASWSNNLQGGAWGSPQRRNPYTGQPYARGGSAGCTECGGLSSLPKGYVPGSTGGQDDLIDAKLSDGEYVFDADTVAALGDGNNAAGAKKLDQMRANIRTHKRAAPAHKIPPKAKHPEAYLNKGK